VVGHSCIPSVTFGGNIKERLTRAYLGDRMYWPDVYEVNTDFVDWK
jgi:hypothetical protein